MKFITKIHCLLVKVGQLLQTPLLLIIRLYWGWQFTVTGRAKFHNLDGFAEHFRQWGIPHPKLNVIMAASTEVGCGFLLLIGLFSRFASAALICVMCVAYYTADSEALHAIFSDPDKFLGADPFLFLFAAVLVFSFGPGKIAVDRFLFKDEPV
jgi:putative oxidoreductase